MESNNTKLKDSFGKVIGRLRVMSEEFNREAIITGADSNEYAEILNEVEEFNLEQELYDLPPCSVETVMFKPFQFGGATNQVQQQMIPGRDGNIMNQLMAMMMQQ